MKNLPLKTILFGKSILLASLESSFKNHEGISIIKSTDDISEFHAISLQGIDLVLFERSLPDAVNIPALLGGRKNLMVFGVDFSSHEITLYSGKEFKINNFSDITQFIFDQAGSCFNH